MFPRLAILTLFGSAFVGASALAGANPNEAAILKIEQDMTTAQTAETVTALWDKDVVFDDLVPGQVVGLDAVRKDLAAQFSHIASFKSTILRIKVEADNKIGFAFSTQHFVGAGKNGAPGLDLVFRETDCFHKKGGKWLLVHQVLSVPFDPKTGKAVFDSK